MKSSVRIPNSELFTSPLGVGLATLMREPSSKQQQRLLHEAYDAGFRHFDVAPSYGLGEAERALGRFLRLHGRDVTVATKVGITARGLPGFNRLLQRPARALLRRFPRLRGRATRAVGATVHTPASFSVDACARSLENSLRALGRVVVELLLLHEARPADVNDDLLEWLHAQRRRGTVRNVGIAADVSSISTILRQHPGQFDVVQFPSNVLTPSIAELGDASPSLRLTHGALATPLQRIEARLQQDRQWARALSERVGKDVMMPGVLAQLLLAWATDENCGGIVLVGASNASHLRSAPSALGAFEISSLADAGRFLRASIEA